MRSQRLFPILLLVRDLDELNVHAIAVTVLSSLVVRERALDERLSGIDISGRGSGPDLHHKQRGQ
jgi:hypothetical protein